MPRPTADMIPLFVVEEPGEWRMEVYEDYILTIDFYEEFAEIVFT
jgi:hypothetical protein